MKNSIKKEKMEQRKAASKKKKFAKQMLWTLVSVAILGAIIFIVVANQKPKPGESVEVMKNQDHLESVDAKHQAYNSDPPTSGPHTENMASWGFNKEVLPKEMLVHNLEDGGIVIYYNDKVKSNDLDKLSNLVSSYSESVVGAPYPEMKNLITLTAWGRMEKLDSYDEKKIKEFISTFKGIDHH